MPHEDRTFLDFSHTAINRPYQKVSNKFQLLLPTALTETFSDAKKNVLDISKVTKHFFFHCRKFFSLHKNIFSYRKKKIRVAGKQTSYHKKRSFCHYNEKRFLGIRNHFCGSGFQET